jgi:hypothetical protein
VAWLLTDAGVDVRWDLAPAVGLLAVGLGLLATLARGRGRPGLVGIGVLMLVAAVAVGIDAARFTGPMGDLTVAPVTSADWPVAQTLSAGRLVVDLREGRLPATGRVDVAVGAGQVRLLLPAGGGIGVEARAVLGTVVVDGHPVAQGVDQRWTSPGASSATVRVHVEVGAGDVEVDHVGS